MSKGIKVSPKYGVNPTLGVCFFCGEETGEIALLGKIGKKGEDIEAPKHMVLNYEPCAKCQEKFNQGVLVIGVTHSPEDNRPEISKDWYPTGQFAVVKPEAVPPYKAGQKVLMRELEFAHLFSEVAKC